MPLRGGASDKAGNRYERAWTVLALLDVLAGDADSIRIEVPGEAGRGAEFLLVRDGTREWHQAKRQRTGGPWTIASLDRAGVLAPWWRKLQSGDRCVFVSGSSAQQLHDLADRAAHAESWAEFDEEFLGAADHRDNFVRLSRAWGITPGEPVFLALRQVSVHVIDESQLKRRVADRAANLVYGDPAAVMRHLAEIAEDSTHVQLTRPEVLRLLTEAGNTPISASAGRYGEGPAHGVQQVFHGPAGTLNVSGGHNTISLRTAGRPVTGRRRSLLASLAATLATVAVGATYLASLGSGIPAYFQTGPGAGINVPSAIARCANVIPDVLISPADNVLTSVSEVHALAIGGRSAFLMQGAFNGATYRWLTSVPNGTFGGMQLRWWLNGGPTHYCTVSLTNAPPAVLAQQGIRQVASMAVPMGIDGKDVNFQACVWYTMNRDSQPEQCWP